MAEPYPIDDGSMVQRIRDNRVLLIEQGFKKTPIGVKTRGVKDRILHPQEVRDLLFECFVLFLRSADKADRSHAVAVSIQRSFGGLNQFGMIRQAKVVIGTEIQDIVAGQNRNVSGLP